MTEYRQKLAEIERLKAEAETLRQQELVDVLANIKRQIQEYGITAAQLGFLSDRLPAKPSKPPVAVKFRDTETGETWGGVGAKPKWLRNHEAAGRKKEEFAV